jgi:30S ribosomal protein S31
MGKGDKKSRKGKISMGSYGVTRPRNKKKTVVTTSKTKKVKPVDKTEEDTAKAAPKKVAAKKAAPKKAAKKTEE